MFWVSSFCTKNSLHKLLYYLDSEPVVGLQHFVLSLIECVFQPLLQHLHKAAGVDVVCWADKSQHCRKSKGNLFTWCWNFILHYRNSLPATHRLVVVYDSTTNLQQDATWEKKMDLKKCHDEPYMFTLHLFVYFPSLLTVFHWPGLFHFCCPALSSVFNPVRVW